MKKRTSGRPSGNECPAGIAQTIFDYPRLSKAAIERIARKAAESSRQMDPEFLQSTALFYRQVAQRLVRRDF